MSFAEIQANNALKLARKNTTTKANISDFFTPVMSKNLLDQSQMIIGDMNTGTGTIASNPLAANIYTPLIGVVSGRTVYLSAVNTGGAQNTFAFFRVFKYDISKNFIGFDTVNWVPSYTIPSGTAYIRLMLATSTWNTSNIYQLEYDKMTPCVKYSNYALNPALNIPRLESNTNIVNGFGDSLSEGAGSTATHDYPAVLTNLIGGGFTVRNFGIGGEGSSSIAMRQGGIPLYVNPFTIPADTATAVTVTFPQALGYDVSLLNHAGAYVDPNFIHLGFNPCTIAGIQGTLSRPDVANNNYTFKRTTAGNAVTLTRPTFLSTYANDNYRNDIAIIWIGTNDTSWTVDQIIQVQQYMVDNLKHKRFIIMGLTSKSYHPDVAAKNTSMMAKWGKHFLDIRTYLLNYGLSDAGITATTQDNTDISNGEIPTSLRSDNVHLNDSGYNIVATQSYKKGVDLGYWR